jgi:hypothetical protein
VKIHALNPRNPPGPHARWRISVCAFVQVFGRRQSRGSRHAQLTGVQKAPRHEVAGSWGRVGSERYGDLMSAPTLMWVQRCQEATGMCGQARWGACNGHLGKRSARISGRGALIAVIGSREITAGIEPARGNGKVATLTVGLSHDVSSVLGIGRQARGRTRTPRSRSCGRRSAGTGKAAHVGRRA